MVLKSSVTPGGPEATSSTKCLVQILWSHQKLCSSDNNYNQTCLNLKDIWSVDFFYDELGYAVTFLHCRSGISVMLQIRWFCESSPSKSLSERLNSRTKTIPR